MVKLMESAKKVSELHLLVERVPMPPEFQDLRDSEEVEQYKQLLQNRDQLNTQLEQVKEKVDFFNGEYDALKPQLARPGFFDRILGYSKDFAHLLSSLDEFKQELEAKVKSYQEPQKTIEKKIGEKRFKILDYFHSLAHKSNLRFNWQFEEFKLNVDLLENDVNEIVNREPEGLIDLSNKQKYINNDEQKLFELRYKYGNLKEFFTGLEQIPGLLDGEKEICDNLNYIEKAGERIDAKIDEFKEHVPSLEAKFQEQVDKVKWVRNYPELYFLHAITGLQNKILGDSNNYCFAPKNVLEALEYNLKEKPAMAYTRSYNTKRRYGDTCIGLKISDGEILTVNATTMCDSTGERRPIETETGLEITEENIRSEPLTVYRKGDRYEHLGNLMTVKSEAEYEALSKDARNSIGSSVSNELGIKNPVFDGIWIDIEGLVRQDGDYRYGGLRKEMIVRGVQRLVNEYDVKLYQLKGKGLEEITAEELSKKVNGTMRQMSYR